jgi:isoleucyl-tRNA synthetase
MDYKSTLNLPKTDFPMKANLPQREPELLEWWDQVGLYVRIQKAGRGICSTTGRRTPMAAFTSVMPSTRF